MELRTRHHLMLGPLEHSCVSAGRKVKKEVTFHMWFDFLRNISLVTDDYVIWFDGSIEGNIHTYNIGLFRHEFRWKAMVYLSLPHLI
jgi:hypothetical protein